MKREEILDAIKGWGEDYIIDGYIYDVLTDGSFYAENWLNQLEECENVGELFEKVQSMFCTR